LHLSAVCHSNFVSLQLPVQMQVQSRTFTPIPPCIVVAPA
jgi:hypothetical protein